MKHQQRMVNHSTDFIRFILLSFLATSGSDNESTVRRRLGRVVESAQETDSSSVPPPQLPLFSGNTSSSDVFEQDDSKPKRTGSVASSIPRKLANDLAEVMATKAPLFD